MNAVDLRSQFSWPRVAVERVICLMDNCFPSTVRRTLYTRNILRPWAFIFHPNVFTPSAAN